MLCSVVARPGTSSTSVQSASRTTSTSSCPTPTVPRMITCLPAASRRARRRPSPAQGLPEIRVAMERMKTLRRRMPLHTDTIAENSAAGIWTRGVHGDNADAAPCGAVCRRQAIHQALLPVPGAPVTPITNARPVNGNNCSRSARLRGCWSSTALMASRRTRERLRRAPAPPKPARRCAQGAHRLHEDSLRIQQLPRDHQPLNLAGAFADRAEL